MELSDFVEQNLPSTLATVKRLKLIDDVLNIFEIALIYHYTDEGFEFVNESLIKDKGVITNVYAQFLVYTLQKLPNYQKLVFRGTLLNKSQKQRYIEAVTQSITIQEPIFLSTSKSELTANLFSKGDTLFTIFSKTGKQIEKFSKFGLNSGQNEKEVLFIPNTTFEVLDVTKEDSKTLIILEEIS